MSTGTETTLLSEKVAPARGSRGKSKDMTKKCRPAIKVSKFTQQFGTGRRLKRWISSIQYLLIPLQLVGSTPAVEVVLVTRLSSPLMHCLSCLFSSSSLVSLSVSMHTLSLAAVSLSLSFSLSLLCSLSYLTLPLSPLVPEPIGGTAGNNNSY